jgi:hypothetical protein
MPVEAVSLNATYSASIQKQLIHRKDAKDAEKFFNENKLNALRPLRSLRLCGEIGVCEISGSSVSVIVL